MAKREYDPVSGYHTTGHEWDGIKELTTPIPSWWVTVFLISCFVAVGYMWLYPSFATTNGYYKGSLSWSSRAQLVEEIAAGRAAQSSWRTGILATPLEEIEANDELRRFAVAGGRAAFKENCAACHGVGAGGQIGQFPSLVDDDWLWGGRLADIDRTVSYGIRSGHEEARDSMMPAFADMLSSREIDAVAEYVTSLSDPEKAGIRDALPGSSIYQTNCASCHGVSGQGGRDFGAPRLDDAIWLYGGTKKEIVEQITNPRMGMMPSFAGRLDEETIRMLTVYVHTLGGGER